MQFESVKKNSKGEHIAYQLPGENFTTIGYGHANQSSVDKKAYPLGTSISDSEAKEIFNNDYEQRKVNIYTNNIFSQSKSDAMTDFSFNTTNVSDKTIRAFNNTSRELRPNFILDNLRNRSESVFKGLAKRRAAEFILYKFGKYTFIDYSPSEQNNWKEAYQNAMIPELLRFSKSSEKK